MTSSIVPYSDDGFQTFDFNGVPVRAKLDDDNNPIILASSICEALNLADVSKALAGLPADEKGKSEVLTPGGWQKVWHVTEAGLYRLIFRSNKPEAEDFRKKVFNEILPAIRKTGKYELTAKPTSQLQILEQMMAVFAEQERKIAAIDQKQAEQAIQIEAITDRLDDADYYTVKQFCLKQRIAFTRSLLSKWGKDATALSRHRTIERKETIEDGYLTGRYHKSVLLDVCVPKPSVDNQLPLAGV